MTFRVVIRAGSPSIRRCLDHLVNDEDPNSEAKQSIICGVLIIDLITCGFGSLGTF